MIKRKILIILLIILIFLIVGLLLLKITYKNGHYNWIHDDIYNSNKFEFKEEFNYNQLIFKNAILRLFPDNNRYTVEFEVTNNTQSEIYHEFVKLSFLDKNDSILFETSLPIESIKVGETQARISTYGELEANLDTVKKFKISKWDGETIKIIDDSLEN